MRSGRSASYARGYYDRSDAAVAELFAVGTMTRTAIEAVARAHRVCPFELSLDAAVWSDIVICDYNYVFDPVVRLKRLAGITADRIALLIDEAHQLGDRVRDALSTVFTRGAISNAFAELFGDASSKRAAALDRRITALRRDTTRALNIDRNAFECRIELPEPVMRAAERLLEALTTDTDSRSTDAAVTELVFALLRLLRVAAWHDAGSFRGLPARPRKRHRDRRTVSRPQRGNCRNVERIPGAHSLLGNGLPVRTDRARARPARGTHAAPSVAFSAGTPRRVRRCPT